MTTTLPHAYSELDGCTNMDSGAGDGAPAISSGQWYDTNYSRGCIFLGAFTQGTRSEDWPAEPNYWFHASHNYSEPTSPPTGVVMAAWYAGATVVAELIQESGAIGTVTYGIYTLQAGTLTHVASYSTPADSLPRLDLHIKAGSIAAGGGLAFYINETEVVPFTAVDHSAFAGITQCAHGGGGFPGSASWSEVIHWNQSTVGKRVVRYNVDTLSAVNTGWTGVVGNIDEIPCDDSTVISAAAAGLCSTYFKTGFSLGGKNVLAVCVNLRAKLETGAGPQKLAPTIRLGGTNYEGPQKTLSLGYTACCASWTTDPSTSAVWQPTAAQAIEAGGTSHT